MKWVIVAATASLLITNDAYASGVSFDYESFTKMPNGAAEIVLKFNNDTGKVVSYVGADCAMLDKDGKAVTVLPVNAQNIAIGGHAFGHSYSQPNDTRIKKAECRVRDFDVE